MKALAALSLIAFLAAAPGAAQELGLVAEDFADSAVVFDADTGQVWGVVALPPGGNEVGDCAVTPDQKLGFVSNGNHELRVIDMTQRPPVLAAGINTIPIGNEGKDIEITPDGKLLLVTGGRDSGPISIVDIATRTVINDFTGSGDEYSALDIDANGNVLVYAFNGAVVDSRLLYYTLDHNGQMFVQSVYAPGYDYYDVAFAPGGQAFAAVDFFGNILDSHTAPPIAYLQSRSLTGPTADGIDCTFRPQGDVVFARSVGPGAIINTIDAFAYNPITGQIGGSPLFTISDLIYYHTYFGVDTMEADRSGKRLYVPQPGEIKMFDADPLGTGQLLGSIPAPLLDPSAVAFSRWPQVFTPMAELGIINLTAIDVFAGGAANDRVTGKGTMELAPGAEPFDPATDNVYVELNDLHFVIPAGSFVEHETFGITWWGYTGTVYNQVFNGTVNMQISFEHSTNWQIKTLGLDTSSAVDNPAVLKIRIGDNTGEFPFAWEQQIHHGAGDYSRYTL